MNQDIKQTKNVLIIDDDPGIASHISEAFERFSNGTFVVDELNDDDLNLKFKTSVCKHPSDIQGISFNSCPYDVLVIDKRFASEELAESILAFLRDILVDAVRIVFTAHSIGEDEIVKCMRLGAWDHINKGPDDSIKKVLISAIRGLQQKTIIQQKRLFDQEVQGYIQHNYKDILGSYKGCFIAIEKIDEADFRVVRKEQSLYKLYEKLGRDRDRYYITLIKD